MLIQSIYSLLENPESACKPPAGSITESSKGHATILSSQLLQDGGEHDKTSELHEHGPTAAVILL